ncbi:MAG TPA: VOC family protein [Variovorax sp.]|nr:VOC family protein [Variovorax sp.]
MAKVHDIVPCLWFEDQAEEAARYYTGIFKSGKVNKVTRYSEVGHEIHGRPSGSVLTVEFEINGKAFTALNGGPQFKFNEAISLQVICEDQEEVDFYWEKLGAGGDPSAQVCGWLKDKYGLSWQVFPEEMLRLLEDQTKESGKRAMAAMMKMKKLDLAAVKAAYDGKTA